jgi:cell division protein ZapA (FtsZ GTPase activity inhibitor)
MFHSILGFVMELGMVYLLTALFVVLDLLLLTTRARRHRSEATEQDERETRRKADEEMQRTAFNQRQEDLHAAS